MAKHLIYNCPLIESKTYRGADKSLARPGRGQATFPTFYGTGFSLPHSQQSTTCPYPSQISPFLCPSHCRQSQLVSFPVGLRTYQHPGIITSIRYLNKCKILSPNQSNDILQHECLYVQYICLTFNHHASYI